MQINAGFGFLCCFGLKSFRHDFYLVDFQYKILMALWGINACK
jgi:hypothetical protein